MVHIIDGEIDYLQIAADAVSVTQKNSAAGPAGTLSTAVTVPNAAPNPVQVFASLRVIYQGVSSGSSGTGSATIRRTRGSKVLATEPYSFSGNGSRTRDFRAACIDMDAQHNDVYTLTGVATAGGGGESAGVSTLSIVAVGTKL